MKKYIAISFLFFLLFNTVSYYPAYFVDLLVVRHQAGKHIEGKDREEDVTTLTFPMREGKILASGLVFNDDDEFSYQGRMYDVISSEEGKNYITFKCYTDDKETALNQDLCNKIDSDEGAPTQRQRNNLLIKIFAQHYTIHTGQTWCFATQLSGAYRQAGQDRLHPLICRAILSPPPESIHA